MALGSPLITLSSVVVVAVDDAGSVGVLPLLEEDLVRRNSKPPAGAGGPLSRKDGSLPAPPLSLDRTEAVLPNVGVCLKEI